MSYLSLNAGKKPEIEPIDKSETEVLSEIVVASEDWPNWQRDALRRLCNMEKLRDVDLDELLAICKGKAEGDPISVKHIRDPAASAIEINLTRLQNLKNVNALQPGETLLFQPSGLTVVYGDNGAGKSGYARILKQACRARLPRNDFVLPNVYEDKKATPEAQIVFNAGTQKQSTIWRQSQEADSRLSAISVFDSDTAAIHVEATNELAYTPFPLRIMATLADSCKTIKAKLEREINEIDKQTPAVLSPPKCSRDSDVGKLIFGLTEKTPIAKVEQLSGLSDAENSRLKVLAADLANDPARIAQQLQSQKVQIDGIRDRLKQLATAVADEKIAELEQLRLNYVSAKKAASVASRRLFADEPLPDVGSDVWRALWESARAFSDESAYPKKTFPLTTEDARCVLCHQELSSEASDRLNRFESFVLDESKKRESEAKIAYQNALGQMQANRISMRDVRAMVILVRDALNNETLAKSLRRSAVNNLSRLRAVRKTLESKVIEVTFPVVNPPIEELDSYSQDLITRADTLLSEKNSPEYQALVFEHNQLKDKEWLKTVKEDVIAEIARMKNIAALKRFSRTTATNKLTILSSELAKRLVTDRLCNQFSEELKHLGLAKQHSIELKHAKTKAGVPLFHLRMADKPDAPIGKVLSEGEHRCVALAAFLAELSTLDTKSGIVFDDPVSSLDHIHKDRVAERLAAESMTRQVIVFTHDISFLLLLDEACQKTRDRAKIDIGYSVVSRGADTAGFCRSEPPANVLPIRKVIEQMRKRLSNVSIHHKRGEQDKWRIEVSSFSVQLRETWERAVEAVVAPVIKRLSRKVDTSGLLSLTVLKEEDCNEMRDAFARCSDLIHSQPGDINPRLPTPTNIENEIQCLDNWFSSIKQRQTR